MLRPNYIQSLFYFVLKCVGLLFFSFFLAAAYSVSFEVWTGHHRKPKWVPRPTLGDNVLLLLIYQQNLLLLLWTETYAVQDRGWEIGSIYYNDTDLICKTGGDKSSVWPFSIWYQAWWFSNRSNHFDPTMTRKQSKPRCIFEPNSTRLSEKD